MLIERIFNRLNEKELEMIKHRRWLHQHPELSFQEVETQKYILNFYKDKDCVVETYQEGYGIRVIIDSGHPGKTIALRADFDALEINEETDLEFKSVLDNRMHACGHDAHTATMMVLADTLIEFKSELKGRVVIIHQPAEELPPGGAISMIKQGVLEGVEVVVGTHVMSQMELGKIFYHAGPTQQARAKFSVKIQGKGGHGSSPHQANDAILIASQFVVSLQSIISRRLNPMESGVITIGSFDGKGSFNIIKDKVELLGDVRSMSSQTMDLIEQELKLMCEGFEKTYSCTIDYEFIRDYPVLMNDYALTDFVVNRLSLVKIEGVTDILDCGPLPPSEDFAYYTYERPSCFFYIGAGNPQTSYPHHHPKFDINESSLLIGAKAMAVVATSFLEND